MKKDLIVFLAVLGTVLAVNYLALAIWQEPTESPPNGNVAPPVNTGADYQRKGGDFEVNNFKASSITLGGVSRSSWPPGMGVACPWEGVRCDCQSDSSTFAAARVTISITCNSGQVVDLRVRNFEITSRKRTCDAVPPPGCTPGLYTYQNNE